jgi:transcriptional regulator with XRE-family HTH domain
MAQGTRRPRRRTAKADGPDPIDIHVGRQVRLARELAGLTQVEVGDRLGMSFQVIQKYEQGEIRVSASRLYQLAQLFDKPIVFFFVSAKNGAAADSVLARREVELVRAYRRIARPEVRQRLFQLVKGMAERAAGLLPPGVAPGPDTQG